MGLEPFVEKEADRLITVNTIKVPAGIDWAALIKNAMDVYNVEIAGDHGHAAEHVQPTISTVVHSYPFVIRTIFLTSHYRWSGPLCRKGVACGHHGLQRPPRQH